MTIHSLSQFGHRHDDPETLFKILSALGLHAGTGTPEEQLGRLQASGRGFSVSAVDEALDKTGLNGLERIIFKRALANKGLLTGVLVP
jgi:hypothetical protein